MIKAAFPSLPPDFFKILLDRIKQSGFTNERLIDSVNNVIDTCKYPTPTISDFISFDRRMKIFEYSELCAMVTKNEAKFEDYTIIEINSKKMWVRK